MVSLNYEDKHEQGSKAWLLDRRHYLGASDAPIIMGDSPWRTPYQLYLEKRGEGIAQNQNKAMSWGHQNEPLSREWFIEKTGIYVQDHIVYHPDYSFIRASLDGISLDKKDVIEIKNPLNDEDHEKAIRKEVPHKYYAQLQHAIECCGTSHIWYVSRHGEGGTFFAVDKDSEYIKKMIDEEVKFWDLVKNGTPPPLTDKDHELICDPALEHLAQRLRELEPLEKEYKQLKDNIKKYSCGKNIMGHGIKISHYQQPGGVDYNSIPALQNINLDQYRKAAIAKTRISLV